ncbi:hypothetical protein MHYP_G00112610 [Metynnis hypsauchen]
MQFSANKTYIKECLDKVMAYFTVLVPAVTICEKHWSIVAQELPPQSLGMNLLLSVDQNWCQLPEMPSVSAGPPVASRMELFQEVPTGESVELQLPTAQEPLDPWRAPSGSFCKPPRSSHPIAGHLQLYVSQSHKGTGLLEYLPPFQLFAPRNIFRHVHHMCLHLSRKPLWRFMLSTIRTIQRGAGRPSPQEQGPITALMNTLGAVRSK